MTVRGNAPVIIRRMKGIPGGRGLKFPVRDENLNVIGYLRGFDNFCLADDSLIGTMARFRTLYRENFLSQFEAAPANKRSWLKDSVLANDRKMLFLVETFEGKIMGQDGFTLDEDGRTFCLDASMRWERGSGDLFQRGGVERAAMGFFLFGREKCVAEIFKSNVIVVDNSLRAGFTMEREFHLRVERKDGMVSYFKEEDADLVNTDAMLLSLSLGRDRFAEMNRSIVENPCWSSQNCGEELVCD
ncbi:MAG: hypothetical protein LBG12_06860 [Synergistaceae bacterium]|jgi:hypothetical protein|nr:hypothetical protein [Synergistaceae bacterium]